MGKDDTMMCQIDKRCDARTSNSRMSDTIAGVERYHGRFERSFIIPEDAEADDVKAEFKDGVLRVHVAKSEKARPKQIEVKVS